MIRVLRLLYSVQDSGSVVEEQGPVFRGVRGARCGGASALGSPVVGLRF